MVSISTINAGVSPANSERTVTFRAIGIVENEIDNQVVSDLIGDTQSSIVINPDLVEGLKGFTPGQQLMVIFHLDRSEEFSLSQHPQGNKNRSKRGVFTLRSPHRPNPIGVTVVNLLEIRENVLIVSGLDAFNKTPVLDLKPV